MTSPCWHQLKRLPKAARPYRYQCIRCQRSLKIARGRVLAQHWHLLASLRRP